MDPTKIRVSDIKRHYDVLSPYYVKFWGDHIHHGYWDTQSDYSSKSEAQRRLVARLAEEAGIPSGARVLDIGCGVGGSAFWLARELNCYVLGISLSPVQVKTARSRASELGLENKVRFEVIDANHLERSLGGYDVIWIIESSEHIIDKGKFFQECAGMLNENGRLALCAWLAGEQFTNEKHRKLVEEVCSGMLCPSLGRGSDYEAWLRNAGFVGVNSEDITAQVAKTWDICRVLEEHPEVKLLLSVFDEQVRDFVRSFSAMQQAYASGAMGYGLFTAQRGSPF